MLFCVWDSAVGCGFLPGAGVPCNYFPPVSGRGWSLTWQLLPLSASILLPPLGIEAGRESKWSSSVRTLSLLVWKAVGRVILLSESGGRVCGFLEPFSDFLAPSFPEPLVLPLLYNTVFILCQKKHLKLGNRQKSWQNIFSATLSLTFYHLWAKVNVYIFICWRCR